MTDDAKMASFSLPTVNVNVNFKYDISSAVRLANQIKSAMNQHISTGRSLASDQFKCGGPGSDSSLLRCGKDPHKYYKIVDLSIANVCGHTYFGRCERHKLVGYMHYRVRTEDGVPMSPYLEISSDEATILLVHES